MGGETRSLTLSDSDQRLLSLLRTKGLSIRRLDFETRASLERFVSELHHKRGLSLSDIAKLIGNKTSGYVSWLCEQLGIRPRSFEESRLKAIREKRRKYERRPFDGTEEDKAYMLGLRHGDLSVSTPWKGVVRVSTSTTHPAMAELFDRLFGRYGHVYRYARYKKDTDSYEWNLSVILDRGFVFLLLSGRGSWRWIDSNPGLKASYLAGLFDAEGYVGLHPSGRFTALVVAYYNTNVEMMYFIYRAIQSLGFHPLRPYLDKRKGFRSPGFKIEMKKDYWRVLVASFAEAQLFLRALPIRHREKLVKKDLAVSLEHRQPWRDVSRRVILTRKRIRKERDEFVAMAKQTVALRERRRLASG